MTCIASMLTWLLATIGLVEAPQGYSTAGAGAILECSCSLDDSSDTEGPDEQDGRPPPARSSGSDGGDIYNGF